MKLLDIEKQVKEKERIINNKLSTLLELITYLKALARKEKEFLSCLKENKKFVKKIENIFDMKNLRVRVTSFKEKLLRLEKEYEELNPATIEEMNLKIKNFH